MHKEYILTPLGSQGCDDGDGISLIDLNITWRDNEIGGAKTQFRRGIQLQPVKLCEPSDQTDADNRQRGGNPQTCTESPDHGAGGHPAHLMRRISQKGPYNVRIRHARSLDGTVQAIFKVGMMLLNEERNLLIGELLRPPVQVPEKYCRKAGRQYQCTPEQNRSEVWMNPYENKKKHTHCGSTDGKVLPACTQRELPAHIPDQGANGTVIVSH